MAIAAPAPESSTEPLDVAALIRAASADDHRSTESRGFITQLMGGELSLEHYVEYLAQYAWVYEALEAWGDDHDRRDIFDPALARLSAIESDLDALGASDWRTAHPPLEATRAYVTHLESIADDDEVRYLAHHYTRYLGDLSGGQAIAKLVARHYGATAEQLTFYDFSDIGPAVPYKREYRERMNNFGLSSEQVDELIAEVAVSFRLNGAIFDELGARAAR